MSDLLQKFESENETFIQAFATLFAPLQAQFMESIRSKPLTLNQKKLLLEAFSKTRTRIHNPDLTFLSEEATDDHLKNIFKNKIRAKDLSRLPCAAMLL